MLWYGCHWLPEWTLIDTKFYSLTMWGHPDLAKEWTEDSPDYQSPLKEFKKSIFGYLSYIKESSN